MFLLRKITITVDISIHALLAESDVEGDNFFYYADISIHALLAESDLNGTPPLTSRANFYPRSPCGERPPVRDIIQWEGIFLSTLSLRRATTRGQLPTTQPPNFYPRSPCGERRRVDFFFVCCIIISIHALLAESDTQFLRLHPKYPISIHALLAESDGLKAIISSITQIFLSTLSLRRATPLSRLNLQRSSTFLSTLSLRRATVISVILII